MHEFLYSCARLSVVVHVITLQRLHCHLRCVGVFRYYTHTVMYHSWLTFCMNYLFLFQYEAITLLHSCLFNCTRMYLILAKHFVRTFMMVNDNTWLSCVHTVEYHFYFTIGKNVTNRRIIWKCVEIISPESETKSISHNNFAITL